MPRSRLPPSPLTSADIAGKDKSHDRDMENVFSLPPPALKSGNESPNSKSQKRNGQSIHPSPPSSPKEEYTGPTVRRKRTLSGSSKAKRTADVALPPPPSRARKIIQMKPKQTAGALGEEQPDLPAKRAPSREESSMVTQPTKRKQTQPSATSAAGRKIARKTAHSIIERRRRSKMNEEFGVLKDLIPACAGIEMHKLAILQAGIEYLRYLEGCIEQLQAQNEGERPRKPVPSLGESGTENDDNDEEDMDVDSERHDVPRPAPSSFAASESDISSPRVTTMLPSMQGQQTIPSFRKSSTPTSAGNSTYASPNLRPVGSTASLSLYQDQTVSSVHSQVVTPNVHSGALCSTSPAPTSAPTPMQTGVSPAFGAFQFSPDLSRTSTWPAINGCAVQSKPSPSLLPLPHAALPLPIPGSVQMNSSRYQPRAGADTSEGHAEATATAALMMMTKDRRGSVDLMRATSGKAMSVKDLLSS